MATTTVLFSHGSWLKPRCHHFPHPSLHPSQFTALSKHSPIRPSVHPSIRHTAPAPPPSLPPSLLPCPAPSTARVWSVVRAPFGATSVVSGLCWPGGMRSSLICSSRPTTATATATAATWCPTDTLSQLMRSTAAVDVSVNERHAERVEQQAAVEPPLRTAPTPPSLNRGRLTASYRRVTVDTCNSSSHRHDMAASINEKCNGWADHCQPYTRLSTTQQPNTFSAAAAAAAVGAWSVWPAVVYTVLYAIARFTSA